MAIKVGITVSGASAATSCARRWRTRTSTSSRSRPDGCRNTRPPAQVRLDPRNLKADITASGDRISVDGDSFQVLALKDPAQLPLEGPGRGRGL